MNNFAMYIDLRDLCPKGVNEEVRDIPCSQCDTITHRGIEQLANGSISESEVRICREISL